MNEEREEYPVAYEVEIRVEGVVKIMVAGSSRAEAEAAAKKQIKGYISVDDAKAVSATVKDPPPRYEGDNPRQVGVHVTHCCALHYCKYGDEDCPVVKRVYAQAYPCEDCHSVGEEY